jgi:hypothetical protein
MGGAATMRGEIAGEAAGLGDLLADTKATARNLLNFATYYQMKARAGRVGSQGLNEVLRRIMNTHLEPGFTLRATASGTG